MTTTTYDDQNIFAKILRGEIPSHRVYEDDAVIAFMDVMPQTIGHTLVVPKAPSRNLLDADAATLPALISTVQKLAVAAEEAFEAAVSREGPSRLFAMLSLLESFDREAAAQRNESFRRFLRKFIASPATQ